jgi:hypothetical protein
MDQVVKVVAFRYPGGCVFEAFVLSCMDGRYPDECESFVREVLKIEIFDHVKLPGAARAIVDCDLNDDGNVVTDALNIAVYEHKVPIIIIVNHADCGKEGHRERFDGNIILEKEHHKGLLKHARIKIMRKYFHVGVILVYEDLTEDRKFIKYCMVE